MMATMLPAPQQQHPQQQAVGLAHPAHHPQHHPQQQQQHSQQAGPEGGCSAAAAGPGSSQSAASAGGGGGSGARHAPAVQWPTPHQLTLSLEKLLLSAECSGELKLPARNLRHFPPRAHTAKFNLKDTVVADISRNKLLELPVECTEFEALEKLVLYHNTIRGIPETVVALQSLQFLDLSRNQLSYLPASLCQLPALQVLIVNNNRLVSLPEEVGKMQNLMELDASCNEIAHLPVQIGDLSALKSLNLRRNHLQEIPVEISYLQLTSLDLSGNRISVLPVELRFMTTVVELNLGENPLTCPPANLCSRGRVHVFKYLEIQAIKEDRKRGVLTDGEYRRSYRITGGGQLNDFRFANGFNADARRKRHTADSGYGSEQPLDRRWSQEFTQEVMDMHTEDARRIVLRAANARSPRKQQQLHPSTAMPPPPPPLTSAGSTGSASSSSSTASSGYSSGHNLPLPPPPASAIAATPAKTSPPNRLLPSNLTGLEDEFNKMLNGLFVSPSQESKANSNSDCHLPSAAESLLDSDNRGSSTSPDDMEKEERRRAAQKVLGKQGPASPLRTAPIQKYNPKCPPPVHSQTTANPPPNRPSSQTPQIPGRAQAKSQLPSPRHNVPLPVPAQQQQQQPKLPAKTSQLPMPSSGNSAKAKPQQGQVQTYRQFKEQLRSQRQSETTYQQSSLSVSSSTTSSSTTTTRGQKLTSSSAAEAINLSEVHSSKSTERKTSSSVSTSKLVSSKSGSTTSMDVKTMQKEAVLSYVKSKTSSPAHSPSHSAHHYDNTGSPLRHQQKRTSGSTSSIPQPTSSLSVGGGSGSMGSLNGSSAGYSSRREVEKSATADAHINQLRMHIESRLRITLPEDLAVSLQDGVVLCHIANHVKPRAVPSIHVPSPAVPKLNAAKCRRNVENFLLACRKIGVREDLICSPADILEPRKQGTVRIAISVAELLRFYQPKSVNGHQITNGHALRT